MFSTHRAVFVIQFVHTEYSLCVHCAQQGNCVPYHMIHSVYTVKCMCSVNTLFYNVLDVDTFELFCLIHMCARNVKRETRNTPASNVINMITGHKTVIIMFIFSDSDGGILKEHVLLPT